MTEERKVHPDCRTCTTNVVSIASKLLLKPRSSVQMNKDSGVTQISGSAIKPNRITTSDQGEDLHDEIHDVEDHPNADIDNPVEENLEVDFQKFKGKKKKLFKLKLKMNKARKANQTAMAAEKKIMETPAESRGISKQKWMEERKTKIGKLLDANGLDD